MPGSTEKGERGQETRHLTKSHSESPGEEGRKSVKGGEGERQAIVRIKIRE